MQRTGREQVGTRELDPVTLTIVGNALRNLCHEMGIAMMKTSYSSIFNEGLDFSCVVFDARGRALGAGEFCPAQIGAIVFTVDWTIQELGADAFEEGDVIVHNDPYRGGCHIPEHMVLKPVFVDRRLVGFVANIAHMTEIGGKAPGGFAADATDVYQEGLRLPPVKLVQRGERNEDVWRILLTNHRTPRSTWGDLHAMIGSLTVGEARLRELHERYGVEGMERISEELLAYSERRMRQEIQAMPDGAYSFEDAIDDDGVVPDRKYWIRVTVYVDGDEAIFDFRASDDQAAGPCNMTFGVTASAVYNAMLHLTSPDIPRNAGCYRPLRILARPGSVMNVAHPGPEVGGNSEIHGRIVDLLFAALAPAIPERVAAAAGGTACNFLFGGVHPESGEYYANYHLEGCGWGGHARADGNNALCVINGNCRNTPVEVFETRYPWRIHALRLVPDSGGAGRHRGGLATERVLGVTAPEITVSQFADRTKTRPWGLFGGLAGMSAMTLVRREGDPEFRTARELFGTASDTKYSGIVLRRGDTVLIRSAGGGGYGEPAGRPAEVVADDVAEGFVSAEAAERLYRAGR
jgi:N-methylhydantoinase B/oxoprolinase/acetone carboxylase alpha subunit